MKICVDCKHHIAGTCGDPGIDDVCGRSQVPNKIHMVTGVGPSHYHDYCRLQRSIVGPSHCGPEAVYFVANDAAVAAAQERLGKIAPGAPLTATEIEDRKLVTFARSGP